MWLLTTLLLLAVTATAEAQSWGAIQRDGGTTGWQLIQCEAGTGWRQCKENEDKLYLRAYYMFGGAPYGEIVKGNIDSPTPEGVETLCNNSVPSNCSFGVSFYDSVNEYINFHHPSGTSDPVTRMYANISNPKPLAQPPGVKFCATIAFSRGSHMLCDDRLRYTEFISAPVANAYEGYSNQFYYAGSLMRYIEQIPGRTYVTSKTKPGVRYVLGDLKFQHNKPDYITGWSISDIYEGYFEVTEVR